VTDPTGDRYEPLPGLLGLPAFVLRKVSRRTRIVLLIGLLSGVVVVLVLVIPAVQESKQDAVREERAAHRALVARTRRRLSEDQRPRRARTTGEASAMAQLQRAITRDARERFRRHALPGPPVRATRCQPASYGESTPRRPGVRRYTCLALTSPSVGFEFVGLMDAHRHRLVWCKTNPQAATDAKPLATVPLAAECFGRQGR
jgi:hypothetical protein